jgi:hypothetical protein
MNGNCPLCIADFQSAGYTLDNAGNRIKEETVGAGGTLARQTARVFNTLGQLKQVTGGAQ